MRRTYRRKYRRTQKSNMRKTYRKSNVRRKNRYTQKSRYLGGMEGVPSEGVPPQSRKAKRATKKAEKREKTLASLNEEAQRLWADCTQAMSEVSEAERKWKQDEDDLETQKALQAAQKNYNSAALAHSKVQEKTDRLKRQQMEERSQSRAQRMADTQKRSDEMLDSSGGESTPIDQDSSPMTSSPRNLAVLNAEMTEVTEADMGDLMRISGNTNTPIGDLTTLFQTYNITIEQIRDLEKIAEEHRSADFSDLIALISQGMLPEEVIGLFSGATAAEEAAAAAETATAAAEAEDVVIGLNHGIHNGIVFSAQSIGSDNRGLKGSRGPQRRLFCLTDKGGLFVVKTKEAGDKIIEHEGRDGKTMSPGLITRWDSGDEHTVAKNIFADCIKIMIALPPAKDGVEEALTFQEPSGTLLERDKSVRMPIQIIFRSEDALQSSYSMDVYGNKSYMRMLGKSYKDSKPAASQGEGVLIHDDQQRKLTRALYMNYSKTKKIWDWLSKHDDGTNGFNIAHHSDINLSQGKVGAIMQKTKNLGKAVVDLGKGSTAKLLDEEGAMRKAHSGAERGALSKFGVAGGDAALRNPDEASMGEQMIYGTHSFARGTKDVVTAVAKATGVTEKKPLFADMRHLGADVWGSLKSKAPEGGWPVAEAPSLDQLVAVTL